MKIWYNRNVNFRKEEKLKQGWQYCANSFLDVDPLARDGLSVHRVRPKAAPTIYLEEELPVDIRHERFHGEIPYDIKGIWKILNDEFKNVVEDAQPLFEHCP